LRLVVTTGVWPGVFGAVTLYVATTTSTGSDVRLSVVFPGKATDVNVRDLSSNTVAAQAYFYGNRQRGELVLPLASLLSARHVFVKLEQGLGFFDKAGWREVPISHPSVSVAPRLVARPRETRSAPVVCCVIPCYNVAPFCGEVVREAARYADHVV